MPRCAAAWAPRGQGLSVRAFIVLTPSRPPDCSSMFQLLSDHPISKPPRIPMRCVNGLPAPAIRLRAEAFGEGPCWP